MTQCDDIAGEDDNGRRSGASHHLRSYAGRRWSLQHLCLERIRSGQRRHQRQHCR